MMENRWSLENVVDNPMNKDFNFKDLLKKSNFNRQSDSLIANYRLINNHNEFIYVIDLPGVKKEDINIELSDFKETLDVTAKRFYLLDEDKAERSVFFYKTLNLPWNINEKEISAKYENGVLTINIPKLESGSGRMKITPI